MENFTIKFYRLSNRGNKNELGQFFCDTHEEVDSLIDKGRKQFGIHLRTNDNLLVNVLDLSGDFLSSYAFEPSECKK